jgi:beta-lactamase class A
MRPEKPARGRASLRIGGGCRSSTRSGTWLALDEKARMLMEEQYRELQVLVGFDTKTSSWYATPRACDRAAAPCSAIDASAGCSNTIRASVPSVRLLLRPVWTIVRSPASRLRRHAQPWPVRGVQSRRTSDEKEPMSRTQTTAAGRERPGHDPAPMRVSRRGMLAGTAGLLVSVAFARRGRTDAAAALEALEAREGGRLGVCILDTGTGRVVGHRMDERFAMCSTFKLPLAAVVLREADQGRLRLADTIHFTRQDMLSYAPVTSANLEQGGMTVRALAEAAQETSDNVAANLLLKRLGGPAAFTTILRSLGDRATRLDRFEPMLNLVLAGEEQDTTTPRAMAASMARFLTGDLLTSASRELLIDWMVRTTTGDKRIRAGLPAGWRAGDKTGTGMADAMTDKYNDVAIAWPPGKAPVVVAAYFDTDTHSAEIRDEDQAVLAEVGRIAAAWVMG